MNGRTAKTLRKIATLTGRTPDYIKRNYKAMPKQQQVLYIAFMKENLQRFNSLSPAQQLTTGGEGTM